jgi:AmiR/NasT family two-component response regulator
VVHPETEDAAARYEREIQRLADKVDQLEEALDTSRHIAASIGVVMASYGVTYEQAFEMVRRASNDTDVELHRVADHILETGEVPAVMASVRPEAETTPDDRPR